jgi:hypothetical protein
MALRSSRHFATVLISIVRWRSLLITERWAHSNGAFASGEHLQTRNWSLVCAHCMCMKNQQPMHFSAMLSISNNWRCIEVCDVVLTRHRDLHLVLTLHRSLDVVLTLHRRLYVVLTLQRDLHLVLALHRSLDVVPTLQRSFYVVPTLHRDLHLVLTLHRRLYLVLMLQRASVFGADAASGVCMWC